jgi:hypothetical protein
VVEEPVVLRKGLLKRLHVDQGRIRANRKNGTDLPVITIQARGGPYKARIAEIHGDSVLMMGEPLSCGARVWIETTAEVTTQ